MIDNLMDLTAQTYVRSDGIGQPEIDDEAADHAWEGDEVIATAS